MARRHPAVHHLIIYSALLPFLVLALFPVVWMAMTAFKHERDLYTMGVSFWFNEPPTLKHFRLLFTQTWFGRWIVNTAKVSGAVVVITLATAVPAAYALARFRLPGAQQIGIAMFMTYLVPPIILFVPLTYAVAMLGLLDSSWALVLVYPTLTIPFCTWLMLGFFRAVPAEIEEAAWIDGCGLMAGLVRVVLPMSVPAIVTVAIFAFTLSMQEYLYAVVLSLPHTEKVITVGLPTMLIRGDIFFWGALMGGGLLVGVPVALLFGAVLDRFIQALTGHSRP